MLYLKNLFACRWKTWKHYLPLIFVRPYVWRFNKIYYLYLGDSPQAWLEANVLVLRTAQVVMENIVLTEHFTDEQ